MATALTLTTAPGFYSTTGVAMTMTAADTGSGNEFPASGKMLILAHNTGGSAYTVTITSSADAATGRTGSVSAQSLAAGEIRAFIIKPNGWKDANGKIQLSASNTAVKFGVMYLP